MDLRLTRRTVKVPFRVMDFEDGCLALPERLLFAKVSRIISYIPYPQWE